MYTEPRSQRNSPDTFPDRPGHSPYTFPDRPGHSPYTFPDRPEHSPYTFYTLLSVHFSPSTMGSVLSSEGSREHKAPAIEDPNPNYDCAVCLEVLNRPMRTRCGHVFCHTCIKASLRNNAYACPYCRTHLSSEGTLAADIMKKMKTVFQNCEECDEKICLSEMRAHMNRCQQYITKYGPLEELGKKTCRALRYTCPYCPVEVDEEGLVQHCLNFHNTEDRLVVCPVCHLVPGGDSSYDSSFLKHLYTRHSMYFENYIDINIVEEALIERVIDLSMIHYMRHSNRS